MLVVKKSILSGKENTMDLDISKEQWERYLEGKEHVQNIFPNLNVDEREFLISGITPEEWSKSIGNYDS